MIHDHINKTVEPTNFTSQHFVFEPFFDVIQSFGCFDFEASSDLSKEMTELHLYQHDQTQFLFTNIS